MFFVIIYLARSQIAVFGCQFRGAEATCSLHGSPAGWRNQSVLTDFHELRKDFSPPKSWFAKAQFMPVFNITSKRS